MFLYNYFKRRAKVLVVGLALMVLLLHSYTSTHPARFFCDGHSIPASFVNDDFCDCEDQSDEYSTAACQDGIFKCKSTSMTIKSSRVRDSIVDCPDGSDELFI
jgi:protein kinase C substrate 80K-H